MTTFGPGKDTHEMCTFGIFVSVPYEEELPPCSLDFPTTAWDNLNPNDPVLKDSSTLNGIFYGSGQ